MQSRIKRRRAWVGAVLLLAAIFSCGDVRADDTPLTPATLGVALAAGPNGAEADQLAQRVKQWFGGDIQNGSKAKISGLDAAFAIEVPGASAAPRVAFDDGRLDLPLKRVGATDLYAGAVKLTEMEAAHYIYIVNGMQRNGADFEVFSVDPDSLPHSDVPHGTLTQQLAFHSKIFAQTTRDWWIYVPAQYKADTPACVMIFQDGGAYTHSVPIAFDNLIAKGAMPVTVGIFIQPGNLPQGVEAEGGRGERNFEYDSVTDRYSHFLLEEILPEVEKTIKLRHDAASRAIAGLSSGASCAFTAAWYRPDQFSKVLSWIGSYTNLHPSKKGGADGANVYPFLIRDQDKKPIRVFLQDGDHDLDNPFGNWPLANQSMAKALAFKGYDYQFSYGHGSHSGRHGEAILPQSLRWLWRDYKPE
jgi:enterochelin esterase-like enzyme